MVMSIFVVSVGSGLSCCGGKDSMDRLLMLLRSGGGGEESWSIVSYNRLLSSFLVYLLYGFSSSVK